MKTLIIGRGLLGSSLKKELSENGEIVSTNNRILWDDEQLVEDSFNTLIQSFFTVSPSDGWRIYWCAGNSSPASILDTPNAEVLMLKKLIYHIKMHSKKSKGTFIYSSSAGGIYSSSNEIIDEFSDVKVTSAYGACKLEAENVAMELASVETVKILIARISTLYGPGQNLLKKQGIITQLSLSVLTGRPQLIYVPMDTMRDYLYVNDCAKKMIKAVTILEKMSFSKNNLPIVTKIFASGQSSSISQIVSKIDSNMFRKSKLLFRDDPLLNNQFFDSKVMCEADSINLTPMHEGISHLINDVRDQLLFDPASGINVAIQ